MGRISHLQGQSPRPTAPPPSGTGRVQAGTREYGSASSLGDSRGKVASAKTFSKRGGCAKAPFSRDRGAPFSPIGRLVVLSPVTWEGCLCGPKGGRCGLRGGGAAVVRVPMWGRRRGQCEDRSLRRSLKGTEPAGRLSPAGPGEEGKVRGRSAS